ncbi:DUF3992 domain-containing protein [Halobacillus sp. ACCC02827]|uniref:DUF3992 domain-containing protein n=1 Tax=Bacillaceae TaxID=186817 RepID=UPI0002A509D3|nr:MULTISPECIES: S-Ena type endospore appendage [Bacillaceae]ELK48221.1 hypothetical protein D479_03463 [Halobacillus sp. BAB-2008]QHT48397.1 DUF3992 domain-containing protein [Bacillus sp. SB49]WJE15629.1 DUF3992 domain-containing protein [Halobacillus sp. ACCC02827]
MALLGGCSDMSVSSVNDAVCFTITLEDTTAGTPVEVWEDSTGFAINGTIMIENNGITETSPTASLLVNDTEVTGFTVAPGESRAITLDNLNSIGISGAGTGSSAVKVSFSLNYKF